MPFQKSAKKPRQPALTARWEPDLSTTGPAGATIGSAGVIALEVEDEAKAAGSTTRRRALRPPRSMAKNMKMPAARNGMGKSRGKSTEADVLSSTASQGSRGLT